MNRQRGFTLPEILVALALSAIVFSAVSNLLSTNRRVAVQEGIDSRLQGNMRLATSELSRTLRNSGFGLPETNLAGWIPWVPGFNANPLLVQGAGTDPDKITIAHCTLSNVARLTADAAQGDTTISVSSTAGFDTASRSLLLLDLDEHAHVFSILGNKLTIDTDPSAAGQQGLSRARAAGTPVCRVDVKTFDIDTEIGTIRVDEHDGTGPIVIADEIIDLQIMPGGTGDHYTLTITGKSRKVDPVKLSHLSRKLTTSVGQRN